MRGRQRAAGDRLGGRDAEERREEGPLESPLVVRRRQGPEDVADVAGLGRLPDAPFLVKGVGDPAAIERGDVRLRLVPREDEQADVARLKRPGAVAAAKLERRLAARAVKERANLLGDQLGVMLTR